MIQIVNLKAFGDNHVLGSPPQWIKEKLLF